jgi:hypothetical protein
MMPITSVKQVNGNTTTYYLNPRFSGVNFEGGDRHDQYKHHPRRREGDCHYTRQSDNTQTRYLHTDHPVPLMSLSTGGRWSAHELCSFGSRRLTNWAYHSADRMRHTTFHRP